jgi:hypothetical protein
VHAQAHAAFCNLLDFSFKVEITSTFVIVTLNKGPTAVRRGLHRRATPEMKQRNTYRMIQRRVQAASINL